jgi:hypothetical protein
MKTWTKKPSWAAQHERLERDWTQRRLPLVQRLLGRRSHRVSDLQRKPGVSSTLQAGITVSISRAKD